MLGGPADDPTLQNGVECTYRVRGNTFVDANGNGTHDLSEPTVGKWVEGKATPMATTAAPAVTGTPTVPVTAVVALRGHRTVQVNWTLPERGTDEGTGGAIAGYRVMLMSPAQAPAPSVVAVAANVSATTDSHTFKGLNNGWEYTPVVVPSQRQGRGPVAAGAAVSPSVTAPGAPSNLRVTPGLPGGTTLNVLWNASTSTPSAEVSGYVLQQRTSATAAAAAGEWAVTVPPAGTANRNFVTGLTSGTSYDFRVRAITATVENAPWSTAVSGTPKATPGSVSNIAVFAGDRSLTLAWTPAAGNGSPVTSYTLQRRYNVADGLTPNPWISAGSAVGSLFPNKTITGLDNGTTYQIRIAANNAGGRGDWVETTGAPDRTAGSLPAPTSVKAVVVPSLDAAGAINATAQINVTWNRVPRATSYAVEWLQVLDATGTTFGDPANATWVKTGVVLQGNATSASITGLAANAIFAVRVRAATPLLSRYGFSAAVTAGRAPAVAPTDVGVVQIVGSRTLRVSWTSLNATDAENNKVTTYKVSWGPTEILVTSDRGSATVTAPANAGTGTPMSYDITGLNTIGQPIRVTVQAVNKIGAGAIGTATYPEPDPG